MAFCFQQREKAVIEECPGAVGASPTGDIDLIGDADDGDVHTTCSYSLVSRTSDSSMEFLTLLYVRMM